jgi:hypothetical protein
VTLTQGVWRKKNGQDAKREFFLLIWFFTVIGYQILFPFSAARHLLPAYPPALMLLINDPAWSFITTSKRVVVSCFISGTLLFASASAYSDYKYAGIYRDYSAEVNAIRSKAGDTFNVWYIGAWGMRYYMERDGAKQLLASLNEPELGDLVVISEMGYLWTPSLAVQNRMVKITEQHYNSWFPLRLFNRKSHAGFYSSGWGMLPFAFSNEPDEVFTLYKIAQ